MPSSYSIQAGSAGVVFPVTVNPVTVNTTVTLSVTFEGQTLTASTVLLPPWNTSDSLTLTAEQAGPAYGGEFDLEYLALLSNPAPASGETVTFSSPSASLELQNTTWPIPAGDDDAYVDVNTADVTSAVHTTLVATVDGVSASLPVTVTIPAGQSSASFQATTVAVTSDTTVNIYAYLGSTSLPSAAITVTP